MREYPSLCNPPFCSGIMSHIKEVYQHPEVSTVINTPRYQRLSTPRKQEHERVINNQQAGAGESYQHSEVWEVSPLYTLRYERCHRCTHLGAGRRSSTHLGAGRRSSTHPESGRRDCYTHLRAGGDCYTPGYMEGELSHPGTWKESYHTRVCRKERMLHTRVCRKERMFPLFIHTQGG